MNFDRRLAIAKFAGLALVAALDPLPATAQPVGGDAVRGGKLFLQCRACHTVGPADPSGVGPNLHGVVGAPAGMRAGYTFSPAMAKSGITWTPAMLDRFLTKSTAVVPGTKMAFAGVAAPQNRADLIAYLATLGPTTR